MKIKKDLLDSYQLDDDRKIDMVKLIDKADGTSNRNTISYSDFMDPYTVSVAEEVIKKNYSISYDINGGYGTSERSIIMFYPSFISLSFEDIPLRVINIEDYGNFNHREVLGSVLGLGLKREKIGDILIHNELIQIIVHCEISEYIKANLQKIGRQNVKCYISDIKYIIPPKESYRLITSTVRSIRLDTISSVGFNESRNNIANYIKNNKFKVNHRPINSTSFSLKEGDMISYRGHGRIILDKILGRTKKDRIKVIVKIII